MKKFWLMFLAVVLISSCSSGHEDDIDASKINKVMVKQDAAYKKSLKFLESQGVNITEFSPKVLISLPADSIFKPETSIVHPDSVGIIRAIAELISRYNHSSIEVTTSVVNKNHNYTDYAIAHNQGEKIVDLLTKYGSYRFIGTTTRQLSKAKVFNPHYKEGKYFIDIELSIV